jgi:hypothetical protein
MWQIIVKSSGQVVDEGYRLVKHTSEIAQAIADELQEQVELMVDGVVFRVIRPERKVRVQERHSD